MLLLLLNLVGVTEAKFSSSTCQANGEGKGRFQPGGVTPLSKDILDVQLKISKIKALLYI